MLVGLFLQLLLEPLPPPLAHFCFHFQFNLAQGAERHFIRFH